MPVTLEELQQTISIEDASRRRDRLAAVDLAEILDLWGDLSEEQATAVFSALGQEEKIALLESLPPGAQERLLTCLSGAPMRALLEEMEPDDLADLIQSVSADVRKAVWGNLSEEAREETRLLLRFDEDEAAGIMTPRY